MRWRSKGGYPDTFVAELNNYPFFVLTVMSLKKEPFELLDKDILVLKLI